MLPAKIEMDSLMLGIEGC